MAKQRKKISIETVADYENYITKEIQKNSLAVFLRDEEGEGKAIQQFMSLSRVNVCDLDKNELEIIELDAFNLWCSQYIADAGWKKFTSRQMSKRRVQKQAIGTLQLEDDAHKKIIALANSHDLNVSNMVRALVKLSRKHKDDLKDIADKLPKKGGK